jgi:hypothetical protein
VGRAGTGLESLDGCAKGNEGGNGDIPRQGRGAEARVMM